MPVVEINGRKYEAQSMNIVVMGDDVFIDGKPGVPVDESGLPHVEGCLWYARGNTYGVRAQLAAEGGTWNEEKKRWEFTEKPTFPQISEVAFIPDPLPEGWLIVPRRDGVKAQNIVVECDQMPGGSGRVVGCFDEGTGYGKPVKRWLVLRPWEPL